MVYNIYYIMPQEGPPLKKEVTYFEGTVAQKETVPTIADIIRRVEGGYINIGDNLVLFLDSLTSAQIVTIFQKDGSIISPSGSLNVKGKNPDNGQIEELLLPPTMTEFWDPTRPLTWYAEVKLRQKGAAVYEDLDKGRDFVSARRNSFLLVEGKKLINGKKQDVIVALRQ